MSDCIGFTAYNKLSEKCQKCSSKNECEKKIKELVGCFTIFQPCIADCVQPCIADCVQPLIQPILYDERQQRRDQLRRDIHKEIMKGGQE